jgi:hypothetical protein
MSSVLERAIAHFSARARNTVEVPEWGVTVYYSTPNGATLSLVQRESKGDAIEAAARIVAHVAEDEAGKKLFSRLDYKDLMVKVDPAIVGRIAGAIMDDAKLDGTPKEQAETEKN